MIGSTQESRGTSGLLAALTAKQSAQREWRAASEAAGGATAVGEAADSSASYDFSSMTPGEMQGVAKKLFDAGEIDLTQLLMLQTMGMPLRKLGPQGEFQPLTEPEKQDYSGRSFDYFQGVRGAIGYLEQTGYAANPTSGYRNWQEILGALEQRQGTPAGIDLFV